MGINSSVSDESIHLFDHLPANRAEREARASAFPARSNPRPSERAETNTPSAMLVGVELEQFTQRVS
jgi:hypothetical protein